MLGQNGGTAQKQSQRNIGPFEILMGYKTTYKEKRGSLLIHRRKLLHTTESGKLQFILFEHLNVTQDNCPLII